MAASPAAVTRRSALRQGTNLEQVPVRIGEVRVASGASLLYTIGLGSCVAIALYDAELGLGGLAHAMLPKPTASHRAGLEARFVTVAVRELLALIEAEGAVRARIRVCLAGGASMFRDVLDGDGLRLGRRNVETAREALTAAGLVVAAEDVFGTYGRSVFLRTTDGELLVTSVNQADVYL